ncbi:MAG TPA: biotin transporter BioY [Candidatus Ozemobacteraceae bacterium]|nr:biotin transporter BioY [Candidatus Ozemobacteraceae bacterium]
MTPSTTLEAPLAPFSIPRGRLFPIIAGAALIALCSGIEIPLRPVPITGQTFGVLYVAALLGPVQGTGAILLYLAAGIAGLPVFSGGSFGLYQLLGPTGGYLIGFIAAAAIVGSLSGRRIGGIRLPRGIAMFLGMLAIYGFGLLRLSAFIGFERAFTHGVLPFLAGDLLKVFLASMLAPRQPVSDPGR